MTERYSFSLTTFSPSGKLVQIEYALKAVDSGATSVGIRTNNGVVLAAIKKSSKLINESTISKIQHITRKIGVVYSGMSPDYQLLVKQARKCAQQYELSLATAIPPEPMVVRIASFMQEYTQMGGVRPFGVSLLVAGWDEETDRPVLYQCDPAGTFFAWKATALGQNSQNGRQLLEKRYNEDLEIADAIHTAILTLKECFEGQLLENNIEIGVCNRSGFKILDLDEVKDCLAAIP